MERVGVWYATGHLGGSVLTGQPGLQHSTQERPTWLWTRLLQAGSRDLSKGDS